MDIALILTLKYQGSQWSLDGEDYSGLEWFSDSPKPTEAELVAQWSDVQFEQEYAAVSFARQIAYQRTADPIFMQYQRGEATKQEWIDAVEAVKEANPYPVKDS